MATKMPVGETKEGRVRRKAADIRAALLQYKVSVSPDPEVAFEDLPPHRQERWIELARKYVEVFG